MPQPDFVPVSPADRVRRGERLPSPDRWTSNRPGELGTTFAPTGPQLGNQGPDQGYGLKLANRFIRRFKLVNGEHHDDVVAGGLAVALKRASLFGRAPVIHDFEHAFSLWGYLGDAEYELIAFRHKYFEAASHHYDITRAIADAVPESTLRLSPEQVKAHEGSWKALFSQ